MFDFLPDLFIIICFGFLGLFGLLISLLLSLALIISPYSFYLRLIYKDHIKASILSDYKSYPPVVRSFLKKPENLPDGYLKTLGIPSYYNELLVSFPKTISLFFFIPASLFLTLSCLFISSRIHPKLHFILDVLPTSLHDYLPYGAFIVTSLIAFCTAILIVGLIYWLTTKPFDQSRYEQYITYLNETFSKDNSLINLYSSNPNYLPKDYWILFNKNRFFMNIKEGKDMLKGLVWGLPVLAVFLFYTPTIMEIFKQKVFLGLF